jgi:hypothetical protein
MYKKQHEKSLELYKVETVSAPVKNDFAGKLYGVISSAIKNFVMKGVPASVLDGYTVTFRCVAEDEVWTLTVRVPAGEIGTLTDMCRQMTEDIETNNFNESKYIASFENQTGNF